MVRIQRESTFAKDMQITRQNSISGTRLLILRVYLAVVCIPGLGISYFSLDSEDLGRGIWMAGSLHVTQRAAEFSQGG